MEMEGGSSRKRERDGEETDPNEEEDETSSERRCRKPDGKRTSKSSDGEAAAAAARDNVNNDTVSSIEETIAVPLEIILREVPTQASSSPASSSPTAAAAKQHQPRGRGKPLLNRAEAQCLLDVGTLSRELDSIVAAAATLFDRRHRCSNFRRQLQHQLRLQQGTGDSQERRLDPRLVPLLPLLRAVGGDVPDQALGRLRDDLDGVVEGLRTAASSLRQFSEQNWSLAESLLDAMGGGGDGYDGVPAGGAVVALEKGKLSDIQDEVCNRIERLLNPENEGEGDSAPRNDDDDETRLSMKDYCERVMNRPPPSASQESSGEQLSQNSRAASRSDDREGDDSQKSASASASLAHNHDDDQEEKENAPSQQHQQQQSAVLQELHNTNSAVAGGGSQSQSSSQHQQQSTTTAAMAMSPSESQREASSCFGGETQNAVDILSTLAMTVSAGAGAGAGASPATWQAGSGGGRESE